MTGKLIVLEGMSGTGKDTQLEKIAFAVFDRSKYTNVLLTRQPNDTVAGRKAREQKKKDKEQNVPPTQNARLYLQLFTQDGIEHCTNTVHPALDNYIDVICARYYHSRIAYQHVQGIPVDEIIAEQRHPEIIVPDLTLILDVPAEVALGRITSSRNETSDMEKLHLMEKLREQYLKMPEYLPEEKIVIIDASRSVEEVYQDAKKSIDELFK